MGKKKQPRSSYPSPPYQLKPIPDRTAQDWKQLDPFLVLLFFRYESWLRAPGVWKAYEAAHGRRRECPSCLTPDQGVCAAWTRFLRRCVCGWVKKKKDLAGRLICPECRKRAVGGIMLWTLPDWLRGQHHSLLEAAGISATGEDPTSVLDLSEASKPAFSDKPPVLQRNPVLLRRIHQQIVEPLLMSLAEKEDHPYLYLRLSAVGMITGTVREVEKRLLARQAHLQSDPRFALQVHTLAATAPHKGRPRDWTTWRQRLETFDLCHRSPSLTWEDIGREILQKEPAYNDHRGNYEHHAMKLYREAKDMIQAAQSGRWPP